MFEAFLAVVKKEIESEDVREYRSQIEAILVQEGITVESPESHREQLLKALRKENPDEVWAVIVRGNEENAKTLRTINDGCRAVAQRQEQERHLLCEEDCLCCSIKKIPERIFACIKDCFCFCKALCCWCCCSQCCTDEQQPMEDQIEEEKQWIEILSNPLYISLEWLRRIYSKSSRIVSENGNNLQEYLIDQSEAFTCAEYAEKEKENENQDVIATALRDSYLLEVIAGNDLHQHKDEYQKRANQIEEFAIAVVGGSTRDQLLDIMDTRGSGCLKQQKPTKFSQSLSLLKIAVVMERKKVCVFPIC